MTRTLKLTVATLTAALLLCVPLIASADSSKPDYNDDEIVTAVSAELADAAPSIKDNHGQSVAWVAQNYDSLVEEREELAGLNHGQVVSAFARSGKAKADKNTPGGKKSKVKKSKSVEAADEDSEDDGPVLNRGQSKKKSLAAEDPTVVADGDEDNNPGHGNKVKKPKKAQDDDQVSEEDQADESDELDGDIDDGGHGSGNGKLNKGQEKKAEKSQDPAGNSAENDTNNKGEKPGQAKKSEDNGNGNGRDEDEVKKNADNRGQTNKATNEDETGVGANEDSGKKNDDNPGQVKKDSNPGGNAILDENEAGKMNEASSGQDKDAPGQEKKAEAGSSSDAGESGVDKNDDNPGQTRKAEREQ